MRALAVPAHDGRRDLVADREHQRRRMRRQAPHRRDRVAPDLPRQLRRSSRNAMCCVHGTPTITRRPCRAAASRRATDGTV